MVRYSCLAFLLFLAAAPVAASAGVGPTTTRVSLTFLGDQGNRGSGEPVQPLGVPANGALISGNGGFVAFNSTATNLSQRPDTNRKPDVFVTDLVSSRGARRVSVANGGAQANGASSVAGISSDGRIVLFTSEASNLTPGDNNKLPDVFVRDRTFGRTFLISVTHGHRMRGQNFADAMSPNGRFVVFTNFSRSRLGSTGIAERVFLRDRRRGRTFPVGGGSDFCPAAVVSNDGRYVAYSCGEHDPSLAIAILLDRKTGHQTVLDVRAEGEAANTTVPTGMSPDGRYTVFTWRGLDPDGNRVWNDVYEYDRVTKTYTLVTTQPPFTENPWSGGVSDDGRYVAFSSDSPNLVAGDTNGVVDVFRRDLMTNTTIRVSVTASSSQSTMGSVGGSISGDGSLVVFQSADGTLVSGDTNGARDVFVRGPLP